MTNYTTFYSSQTTGPLKHSGKFTLWYKCNVTLPDVIYSFYYVGNDKACDGFTDKITLDLHKMMRENT